jgi:antitoxin (DNA-binding transcriptional repressor) of toxin-antitoxin stability system
MKASIVDLRTNMRDITKALSRSEEVVIYSHGKPLAVMSAVKKISSVQATDKLSVVEHPFFGSDVASEPSVDTVMSQLRGGRFDAL